MLTNSTRADLAGQAFQSATLRELFRADLNGPCELTAEAAAACIARYESEIEAIARVLEIACWYDAPLAV